MFGEKRLQMRLNAVLLQPRVDAEFVGGVVEHLRQPDLERVAVAAADFPRADSGSPFSAESWSGAGGPSSTSEQGGLIQFSGL